MTLTRISEQVQVAPMMHNILKLIIIFFTIMVFYACGGMMQTVKQTFAKGNAHNAYDRQDYPAALSGYRNAADLGDAEAQYYLSFMYLEGQGTTKDPKAATVYMQKAAEGGFAPAQVQMGLRHIAGSGVSRDSAQAYAFFRKAAQSENPEAQYFLAVMLATGQGTTRNTDDALRWFRLAKSNGFPVPDDLLTSEGIAALDGQMQQQTTPSLASPLPTGKELILKIQAGLTRLGFQPGPVDGIFGSQTASAIRSFQSRSGIAIDGNATPGLLKRIDP